jgi:hypothetical protein
MAIKSVNGVSWQCGIQRQRRRLLNYCYTRIGIELQQECHCNIVVYGADVSETAGMDDKRRSVSFDRV